MSRAPGRFLSGTKPFAGEPGGHPRVNVPCRFTREMGLTHEEFFRELPAALGHRSFVAEAGRVSVNLERGSLVISLGSEQTRRIAALCLPYTVVDFAFEGVGAIERERFMQRFDLSFRRGGG